MCLFSLPKCYCANCGVLQEGHVTVGGIDNVLVTAASRGIIQREHQRDALFYKNYSQINPFERITKDDLEAYKQEVEKKSRRGYGKGNELVKNLSV